MKEVAATYEKWERVTSPFYENEKWYIMVVNPKTDKEKKVRWYGEIPDFTDYSFVFGFARDHITIFKGINKENHDFFKKSVARYSEFFGWYFVCEDPVPEVLPENVKAVPLYWTEVEGKFKDRTELEKITKSKIGKIYKEIINV